jgi:HNH endonuclease
MDRELEQFVWERAKHRCEYCRFPAAIALLPFQIDHIISQKLHGPTTAENLALCCERCNSHKGPLAACYLEGKHVPLFNPRMDQWHNWHGFSRWNRRASRGRLAVRAVERPHAARAYRGPAV